MAWRRLTRSGGLCGAALFAIWLGGCGGHAARTAKFRTALDEGNALGAIDAIDDELDVKSSKELPSKIEGDNALLVLDRASIQQSLVQWDMSKKDFEASDKAIDMLDLSRNAGDSIGTYMFSDSAGRYKAPPYEKLLINTLNMVNYLETRDLNGARIEARRLAVMQKYYRESLNDEANPVLGLGSLLAGFVFEKSNEYDEALRDYDDALQFIGGAALSEAVKRLAPDSAFRSPRIKKIAGDNPQPVPDDGKGEVLLIVGYGRVPHKIAQRIPIGLALTYVSGAISPDDRARANELAAQGLVTWVNFPTLAPGRGSEEVPSCRLNGDFVQLEQAVDVEAQVRSEWKKIESKVILSAITRMISRLAVGAGIKVASGKDSLVGVLASLGTQAALTALDTPDTRSWETLPARVAIARVRLPPGTHRIAIDARGWTRDQEVTVEKGGWSVVSLMALR